MWETLPQDVFVRTFLYLDPAKIFACKAVSAGWNKKLKDKNLWKQMVKLHHFELYSSQIGPKKHVEFMKDLHRHSVAPSIENFEFTAFILMNGEQIDMFAWQGSGEGIPFRASSPWYPEVVQAKEKIGHVPFTEENYNFELKLYIFLKKSNGDESEKIKFRYFKFGPTSVSRTEEGLIFLNDEVSWLTFDFVETEEEDRLNIDIGIAVEDNIYTSIYNENHFSTFVEKLGFQY